VTVVEDLPKTRWGKILRKSMREIADRGETAVPSTIEDPAVLEWLRPVLHRPMRHSSTACESAAICAEPAPAKKSM
jgi:hypothetical protein